VSLARPPDIYRVNAGTKFKGNDSIDNSEKLRENGRWANKKRKYEEPFDSSCPCMAANLATLRAQVELALAGRVVSPFTFYDRKIVENVSTGISEVDALVGGLPRGGLTEICGPPCSGRTSLLFSALGARTTDAEACALIDGSDAFDPHSGEAAGINLKQLLWVRCHTLEQSFRATDFLLQAGGFGFIALDLSDIPRESVHRVPLDTWFRFRRAVEGTPTILLVLEQEPHAKTCASLVLRMEAERTRWKSTLTSTHVSGHVSDHVSDHTADFPRYPFSRLLDGSKVRAEIIRSRTHQGIKTDFQDGRDPRTRDDRSIVFETDVFETHIFEAREITGFQPR
jgi:recombination protein RecA